MDGYWVESARNQRIFFGHHQGFTPTVGPRARFGWWFQKLVEPGKACCIVYRTELCYSDRGAVVFTKHASSYAHQQKFWAESSDSILPWLEWCLIIYVIICWTHLLHWRLFTVQLMAVLNSATWWSTTARMSVLRQWSLVLKLCFYRICKHSTFKRLFHNLWTAHNFWWENCHLSSDSLVNHGSCTHRF